MNAPQHGTAVARWSSGRGWRGVWITGASGAGKSDLAMRLAGRGWRLIADDYAHLFASDETLYAVAPPAIAGRIEARGVGVRPVCALGVTRLVMVIELTSGPIERLPEVEIVEILGVRMPRLRLGGSEASAPEKVALALAAL